MVQLIKAAPRLMGLASLFCAIAVVSTCVVILVSVTKAMESEQVGSPINQTTAGLRMVRKVFRTNAKSYESVAQQGKVKREVASTQEFATFPLNFGLNLPKLQDITFNSRGAYDLSDIRRPSFQPRPSYKSHFPTKSDLSVLGLEMAKKESEVPKEKSKECYLNGIIIASVALALGIFQLTILAASFRAAQGATLASTLGRIWIGANVIGAVAAITLGLIRSAQSAVWYEVLVSTSTAWALLVYVLILTAVVNAGSVILAVYVCKKNGSTANA